MAVVIDIRVASKVHEPGVGDLIVFSENEIYFICRLDSKYLLVSATRLGATTYKYDSIDELLDSIQSVIKEIIPADKIQITIID